MGLDAALRSMAAMQICDTARLMARLRVCADTGRILLLLGPSGGLPGRLFEL